MRNLRTDVVNFGSPLRQLEFSLGDGGIDWGRSLR